MSDNATAPPRRTRFVDNAPPPPSPGRGAAAAPMFDDDEIRHAIGRLLTEGSVARAGSSALEVKRDLQCLQRAILKSAHWQPDASARLPRWVSVTKAHPWEDGFVGYLVVQEGLFVGLDGKCVDRNNNRLRNGRGGRAS